MEGGFSIHYDWEVDTSPSGSIVDKKITELQVQSNILSITTAQWGPPSKEVFPLFLFDSPHSTYFIQYQKRDPSLDPTKATYRWLSPRGATREIALYYRGKAIHRLEKRLYPKHIYELVFNEQGLVEKKNLYDRHFKLQGYYLYQYDDRKLITGRVFSTVAVSLKKR